MKVGDTVRIRRPNVEYNNYIGKIVFAPNPQAFIVELESFTKAGNTLHPVVPEHFLELVEEDK